MLKVDKETYLPGEPVVLQLLVTNPTHEAFKTFFPSAQKYDFVVKNSEKEIWSWSRDKMFAMVVTEFKLEPGESVSFQANWNQTDNEGKTIAAGEYELIGILKTQTEVISESVNAKITPERKEAGR